MHERGERANEANRMRMHHYLRRKRCTTHAGTHVLGIASHLYERHLDEKSLQLHFYARGIASIQLAETFAGGAALTNERWNEMEDFTAAG